MSFSISCSRHIVKGANDYAVQPGSRREQFETVLMLHQSSLTGTLLTVVCRCVDVAGDVRPIVLQPHWVVHLSLSRMFHQRWAVGHIYETCLEHFRYDNLNGTASVVLYQNESITENVDLRFAVTLAGSILPTSWPLYLSGYEGRQRLWPAPLWEFFLDKGSFWVSLFQACASYGQVCGIRYLVRLLLYRWCPHHDR